MNFTEKLAQINFNDQAHNEKAAGACFKMQPKIYASTIAIVEEKCNLVGGPFPVPTLFRSLLAALVTSCMSREVHTCALTSAEVAEAGWWTPRSVCGCEGGSGPMLKEDPLLRPPSAELLFIRDEKREATKSVDWTSTQSPSCFRAQADHEG
jgi:hypothetical protein